jgi:hypothetical protein
MLGCKSKKGVGVYSGGEEESGGVTYAADTQERKSRKRERVSSATVPPTAGVAFQRLQIQKDTDRQSYA